VYVYLFTNFSPAKAIEKRKKRREKGKKEEKRKKEKKKKPAQMEAGWETPSAARLESGF